MSLENKPQTTEIDFENISLLPLEKIRMAPPPLKAGDLTSNQLQTLREIGELTLKKYHEYQAIPFNIIAGDIIPNELKKIIYFPKFGLLINPEIISYVSHTPIYSVEKIETSNQGILGVILEHPNKLQLIADQFQYQKGFFGNDKEILTKLRRKEIYNNDAVIMENTTRLLSGCICTQTDIVDIIQFEKDIGIYMNEGKLKYNKWITKRGGDLIVVNSKLEYLEDFKEKELFTIRV